MSALDQEAPVHCRNWSLKYYTNKLYVFTKTSLAHYKIYLTLLVIGWGCTGVSANRAVHLEIRQTSPVAYIFLLCFRQLFLYNEKGLVYLL